MSDSVDDDFEKKFFDHVDANTSKYIEQLKEAVGIPSISAELDNHLDDINKMIYWTKEHIEKLGGKTTIVSNPVETEKQKLPPILLGEFIINPNLKTVCVYGHLDVQPASKDDGWDTEPFELIEKNEKLYGRGSTDDKGPALTWLWVIDAYQKLNKPLPVNIKLIFEGMEESGSLGLVEVVTNEAKDNKFLSDVDFFCISDNYWLGKTKPCLTYGLRGLAYFQITIQGCEQDLHSGVLGGTVHESMTDLIKLLGTIVDTNGTILIDGIMDSVRDVTKEEEELYETIDFNLESYKEENKILNNNNNQLLHNTKQSLLMHRWRYPTCSIHGIEGAFYGPGAKTVIPAKVIGKFSLRLVPDQDPIVIEQLVTTHLKKEFQKLNTPNKLTIEMIHGAKAWLSDPKHPNFEAAAKAIERVYNGQRPDYTREGGSIPITNTFEDATGGMNVLLLPIGACDDMAHSQNEKYNKINLINGTKVLGLYLDELGKIKGPKPSKCRCVPLSNEELMIPGAFLKGFKCKCEM